MRHSSEEPTEPPGELEQLQWVQRLAYSLCSDPALADDIGQEVLLAGFHAAPTGRRERRAWLLGALRNRLRMARRGGARRRDHELRAAGDQAREGTGGPPAPDALLERFESHRRVSQAVAKLREPYRSTLLRRYFEGLTPSAIAQLEGISVGTVKTRITRGLKELRGELEDEFGNGHDGSAGWLAALVPLAKLHRDRMLDGPGLEALPSGSTHTLTMGGGSVALVIGGVAAGITALLLSRSGVDEELPAAVPTPTAVAANIQVSPVSTSTGTRVESQAIGGEALPQLGDSSEPETASPFVDLTVSVIYPDGQSVTGASVQILEEGSLESNSLGTTDGTGRLSTRVPRAAATLSCDQPHLAVVIPGSVLNVGTEQIATIVVAPPRTIEGTVLDPEGLPLEGASVTYRAAEDLRLLQNLPLNRATRPSWLAVTDESGSFTLAGVPELPASRIVVAHERFATLDIALEDTGAVYRLVHMRGEPRGLSGRVLGLDGEPAEGAYIAIGSQSTRSDERGLFRVDVSPGTEVEIRAALPGIGFGSWTGRVQPTGEEIAIRLSIEPRVLRGRITLPSGGPAAGLRIGLLDRTDFGVVEQAAQRKFVYTSVEGVLAGGSRSDVSDLDGRFDLTVLKDRSYRLMLVDGETLAAVITDPLTGSGLEHDLIFGGSPAPTAVHGRVTGSDGKPLVGADVSASVRGPERDGDRMANTGILGPRCLTDDEGRFSFEALSLGDFTQLHVFAGPHYEDALRAVTEAGEAIHFTLPQTVPFFVRGTGAEALLADRFELRDPVSEEPLALSQVEGTRTFHLFGAELKDGRSPVYRVRAGRHLLVLMRGDKELLRTTVRVQDLTDTQIIDI